MLWSASGPKIAMKADAFGQLAEKARDWVRPSDGREDQRDHARPAGQGAAPAGRCGRDEPVDRVPGGDGGEPGAQADVMIQRGHGMQVRLLHRPEHQGGGQEREQRCLRGAAPAGPADDDAGDGQDQQQAGPGPGLAEHLQRGGRARDPGQHRLLETSQVAAAAGPQSGGQQRGRGGQHGPGAPGREQAAGGPGCGKQGERGDERVEQQRGVGRGVGQRQGGRRRDHPPGRRFPDPGADHAPGRQRDQEHRHRVVGGERPQVQGRAEHGEQCGGEERGPPPEQPGGSAPQQDRGAEHERQRQDPRAGQPADAVRRRADRRVKDRRAREILRERRNRHAVQPVRPFQVPGMQVQGLTLGCGVGPQQPQRQSRLNRQHNQQRPTAGHTPAAGTALTRQSQRRDGPRRGRRRR